MFKKVLSKRFYSPLPRAVRNRAVGRQLDLEYPVPQPGQSYIPPASTIIQQHHPIATTILNEPTIIVERQIEMMNVFLGFEQANKYAIMDVLGNKIGYMQERDFSFMKSIMRQVYKLHRPFTVDVFDNWGNLLLTIVRPFSWINSHIKAILPEDMAVNNNVAKTSYSHPHISSSSQFGGNLPTPQTVSTSEGTLVGESVQNWHLWRRRYELFQRDSDSPNSFTQYSQIDAPFLSFEFPLLDESGKIMGSVDRNWVGLGRELFTDTGIYVVRMDSTQSFEGVYPPEIVSDHVLNLDQRAVVLANAVSIDFDYFSRHSNGSGGLIGFGGYDE